MTSHPLKRWFGNSLVNIVGGLATAGVNLLLPAIVVKHLSHEAFSVWNLALQVVVYVNLLSLGLQIATARAVAHATDAGGDVSAQLASLLRAARSIAYHASLAALLLVAVLVIAYPYFFPDISPPLVGQFRVALALLGVAATSQIIAQVDMGIFQGLHRNAVFVGVQMAVRLLTVLLVWLGVCANASLATMSALMAVAMILLLPAMRVVVHKFVAWAGGLRRTKLDRSLRNELLHYSATLSVWSVSMLLINSAGILIVGRTDYTMTGAYAIAMTAISVLVGLLGAAMAPLMTTAASLHASEDTRPQLPSLLMRSTFGVAVALNLGFAVAIALHAPALKLWVGESFVASVSPLLLVLAAAHCLRNIGSAYALMLLATGLHTRALLSAALEAVSTLAASLILGLHWGAFGVACGSLVGAVVGLLGTLWMNTGSTLELTPRPLAFALKAIALPILLFLPLHFWLIHEFT